MTSGWHRRIVLLLAFVLGALAPIRAPEGRVEGEGREDADGSRELEPEGEKIAGLRAELRALRRAAARPHHGRALWSDVPAIPLRIAAPRRDAPRPDWLRPRRIPPPDEAPIG